MSKAQAQCAARVRPRDKPNTVLTTCVGGTRGGPVGTAGRGPPRWGLLLFSSRLHTSQQVTPEKPAGPRDPVWTSFSVCSGEGELSLPLTMGWEPPLWCVALKGLLAAAWSSWAGLTLVPAKNPLDRAMLVGLFGP